MMINGIKTITIHAPWENFVLAMMVVAIAVVTAQIPFTPSFAFQCGPFFLSQRRTIPA